MITIFITAEHTYTWEHFLATTGSSLAPEIQFIPYGRTVDVKAMPAGTAIFTDIDRLALGQKAAAAKIHERISRLRPDIRVLNSPRGSKRRYDLLSSLHEGGINPFRVYRADQDWRNARFPVFVRIADDHSAPRTQLISQIDDAESEIRQLRGWERWKSSSNNRRESDSPARALRVKPESGAATITLPRDNSLMGLLCRARRRWHPLKDILVCEFAATADSDGLYHKFGAFVVGKRIVPAHLWFSEYWVVKFSASRQDAFYLDKEMEYLQSNPHAKQLLEVCALAGIQFGRIDYSLDGEGGIAVWEINTNPQILPNIADPVLAANRMDSNKLFAAEFRDALAELAMPPVVRPPEQARLVADAVLGRPR